MEFYENDQEFDLIPETTGECVHCGAYVHDLDEHGLCGTEGNNCQADEDLRDEYMSLAMQSNLEFGDE